MDDKPPPYDYDESSTTTSAPSAPPAYFSSHPGNETKGVDWSLNSQPGRNSQHSEPGPSAPSFTETESGSSTKGIDWSLNRPAPTPPARTVSKHPQPFTIPGREFQNAQIPSSSNPFARWKENFSRNYPGSKFSRDTPSIMKVEIPKNGAFPTVGYATCPDCFNVGPHQTQYIKKKEGFMSTKKIPAQKCRGCSKLVYFLHSDHVFEPSPKLPRDKPPPYTNQPSQVGFNRTLLHERGHGWGSSEELGHGWNPGEDSGHGWG